VPSDVNKNFIKPSKTKLEFVSPGCTLAEMHIAYLFLKSRPLCFREVMVMIGTGNPDIDLLSSFLS
jgi:hypothetical protein